MNTSNVTFTVISKGAEMEELQRRTNNIQRLLTDSKEIELLAKPSRSAVAPDVESKAEPITMTAIAMAFLGGGAAVALINAIRAVHPSAKDSSVEYNLDLGEEKGKLKLIAKNLTRDQTTSLLEKWNELLGSVASSTRE